MNEVLYLQEVINLKEARQQSFMIDLMWEYKKCSSYSEFGKAVEALLIKAGKIES